MAERKLGVSFLTFEQMWQAADGFLAQYHPDGQIPVPIEEIVELGMKLSIEVWPLLLENCGAEAFITKGLDAIYVNHDIYFHQIQNRYRFGLAHEVGHLILHKKIIPQIRFESVAE